jgi:hypothetical protein
MCLIYDVTYLRCRCVLDRTEYCEGVNPGEMHTIAKATDKERVNRRCPTCVRIEKIREQYQQGLSGQQQIEEQIADLQRGMMKGFVFVEEVEDV